MGYQYGFEKMAVWQMARQVARQIYLVTKSFPKEELYGLTSQIRRSAISISCNLAEGSARWGEKDQNRFYTMAFSSAVEVVNLLIMSNDFGILQEQEYHQLRQEMEKLTYQINKLANRLPGVEESDTPYSQDLPFL